MVFSSYHTNSQENRFVNSKHIASIKKINHTTSSNSLNRLSETTQPFAQIDTLPRSSYYYNQLSRKYKKLGCIRHNKNKYNVKMSTINEKRSGSFDHRKLSNARASQSDKSKRNKKTTIKSGDKNNKNMVVDKNYSYHDRSRAPFRALKKNIDVPSGLANYNRLLNCN